MLLPVLQATTAIVVGMLTLLIVPVFAFFVLKDRPALGRAFASAVPREWLPDIEAITAIISRVFGSWVRGQLLLGLVVGIGTFIGLFVLGQTVNPIFMRFAVLLSVIAGVLELLPIIGPILAAIPAILHRSDRRHRGDDRGVHPVLRDSAAGEQPPRPEDPG